MPDDINTIIDRARDTLRQTIDDAARDLVRYNRANPREPSEDYVYAVHTSEEGREDARLDLTGLIQLQNALYDALIKHLLMPFSRPGRLEALVEELQEIADREEQDSGAMLARALLKEHDL